MPVPFNPVQRVTGTPFISMERETGLEPATTCLEGTEDKRREPLASFMDGIILGKGSLVNNLVCRNFLRCDFILLRLLPSGLE